MLKLVHMNTGAEVEVGELVTDFRGDEAIVTGFEAPRHAASTGRVYVRPVDADWTQGYFPSVFDLEWIGRSDRG